ncbi:hypothetical protein [Aeromicrobium alkaliterrae]|uniref:Major facilitator superfamily (MFS) profile domain-containing protein n=1 Tax=Aeromicrobium alkaliterrae TaxID=302168 RepID=A0ABN2JST8_9ACTN
MGLRLRGWLVMLSAYGALWLGGTVVALLIRANGPADSDTGWWGFLGFLGLLLTLVAIALGSLVVALARATWGPVLRGLVGAAVGLAGTAALTGLWLVVVNL